MSPEPKPPLWQVNGISGGRSRALEHRAAAWVSLEPAGNLEFALQSKPAIYGFLERVRGGRYMPIMNIYVPRSGVAPLIKRYSADTRACHETVDPIVIAPGCLGRQRSVNRM